VFQSFTEHILYIIMFTALIFILGFNIARGLADISFVNTIQTTPADEGDFLFVGCFAFNTSGSTLPLRSVVPSLDVLNIENCSSACFKISKSYSVSGIAQGNTCLCDYYAPRNATLLDSTACNLPCSGNSLESCGGDGALAVYSRQSIVEVMTALATIQPAATPVLSLIDSVTSDNVEFVGPQIIGNISTFVNTFNAASSTIITSCLNPTGVILTGDFGDEAKAAWENSMGLIKSISEALGGPVDVLQPNFGTQVVSALNSLSQAGQIALNDFGSICAPAETTPGFLLLTDVDATISSVLAQYGAPPVEAGY